MKPIYVVIVLVLVGCFRAQKWHRPGASEADFNADCGYCRQMAATTMAQVPVTPPPQPYPGQLQMYDWSGANRFQQEERIFMGCMQSRGWVLK